MVLTQHFEGILAICGGILVHLSFGTQYTVGNMSPYIVSYLRHEASEKSLRYADSIWLFTVSEMNLGIFIALGGMMQSKIGSRWTSLIGGTVLSFGVFITYFTIQKSFVAVVFTYGFLFGMGVGISYTPTIGCALKWFPSRTGLITGIIVSGFGSGAFIFNQVQTAFINPHNLKANVTEIPYDEKYFGQPELLRNVPAVFILLGFVYTAMTFVGSLLLTEPEADNVSQEIVYTSLIENNDSEFKESQDPDDYIEDKHPMVVIKTREFWTLWFMFLTNGQAVQFAGVLYKTYGQTFIADDRFLAIVGSFASILNGLGRIFWGYLADKICFRLAMIIQCITMASLFLTFTLTEKVGEWMYFIWVCLMFGTFSGNFSLFPVVTDKAFGQKYFAVNYGMVFSSQIFACPAGALLAQYFSDSLGWFGMFSLVAGFSILTLMLVISFNKKKPNGKYI